jgi:hypothetical protein
MSLTVTGFVLISRDAMIASACPHYAAEHARNRTITDTTTRATSAIRGEASLVQGPSRSTSA